MSNLRGHIDKKIKDLKAEIKDFEGQYHKAKFGGLQPLWAILGVIGLFFYILPGLLFMIIALLQYNNNKDTMLRLSLRINELKRQLSDYEFKLTELKSKSK